MITIWQVINSIFQLEMEEKLHFQEIYEIRKDPNVKGINLHPSKTIKDNRTKAKK